MHEVQPEFGLGWGVGRGHEARVDRERDDLLREGCQLGIELPVTPVEYGYPVADPESQDATEVLSLLTIHRQFEAGIERAV